MMLKSRTTQQKHIEGSLKEKVTIDKLSKSPEGNCYYFLNYVQGKQTLILMDLHI